MKYKFRAEFMGDVNALLALIPKEKIIKYTYFPLTIEHKSEIIILPDTEVTIQLHNLSLEELRDIMKRVEDGHVMVQTLALAENYTGERIIEESL